MVIEFLISDVESDLHALKFVDGDQISRLKEETSKIEINEIK